MLKVRPSLTSALGNGEMLRLLVLAVLVLLRMCPVSGDEAADDERDFHDNTGVADCEEGEADDDNDFCDKLGDLLEKDEPELSIKFFKELSIISRSLKL